jgi:hypothetical protein
MCSAAVVNSDRTQFSEEIAALNMKPLWERVMRLEPGTAAVPAIWRWKEVRPLLERACELITAKEAERRVLMLRTRRSRERPSSPPPCTPACRRSCRARSRPRTGMRPTRCASSWKARVPTPRSKASA